jgi:hypothetical protein
VFEQYDHQGYIMKPYLAPNRTPLVGMILLLGGPPVLGLAIGALGYYGSPYLIVRYQFIDTIQSNVDGNAEQAGAAFDAMLVERPGSSSLLGFIKWRADQGDRYANFFPDNGMPVHAFAVTLKSPWVWLYWALETALFSLPIVWMAYDEGQRPFSASANDWYESIPEQICAVPLQDKEQLLVLIKEHRLFETCELAVADDEIAHPKIELYGQRSLNRRGDVLFSVKQTYLDKKANIKRKILGRWEMPEQTYLAFARRVKAFSTTWPAN